MKTVQELPSGYSEKLVIDLQKNKKEAIVVNGLAVIVMAVMYFVRQIKEPFVDWLDRTVRDGGIVWALLIIGAGTVVYVILHEFTHGLAMKISGGMRVKYGFTGLYAYAGSEKDYFPKWRYIFIALAPVVLWGIIFAVLETAFPALGWSIYFLQMINVSGAAGDLYVTCRMLMMPGSVLVMDTGVNMTVFDKD